MNQTDMDHTEFERGLADGGYLEVATRSHSPHHATQPHAHDVDIRALVLDGEITLTVAGAATRYGPGEVFTMEHGCEHAETVGRQASPSSPAAAAPDVSAATTTRRHGGVLARHRASTRTGRR